MPQSKATDERHPFRGTRPSSSPLSHLSNWRLQLYWSPYAFKTAQWSHTHTHDSSIVPYPCAFWSPLCLSSTVTNMVNTQGIVRCFIVSDPVGGMPHASNLPGSQNKDQHQRIRFQHLESRSRFLTIFSKLHFRSTFLLYRHIKQTIF